MSIWGGLTSGASTSADIVAVTSTPVVSNAKAMKYVPPYNGGLDSEWTKINSLPNRPVEE